MSSGHLFDIAIWLALLAGAAIAFWNARAAGLGWEDSKIVGGFGRAMMWCGVVQSALGFSSIFLILITMLLEAHHRLPPESASFVKGVWYAAYIIPATGVGFCIAIQRWLTFAEDKDTFSARRALGTTTRAFYGINNTAAIFSAPPAVSNGDGSGKASSKDNGFIFAVVIVGAAFLGGGLITYLIVASYSYKVRSERTRAPRLHKNAVAEIRHRARQIF